MGGRRRRLGWQRRWVDAVHPTQVLVKDEVTTGTWAKVVVIKMTSSAPVVKLADPRVRLEAVTTRGGVWPAALRDRAWRPRGWW